jgi:mercuric ion binding protein
MSKLILSRALSVLLHVGITSLGAFHPYGSEAVAAKAANQKRVTLAMQNMYCATCPHTVKASLEQVPGVSSVSFDDKTAEVDYDSSKTNVEALVQATTNAEYPSSLKN